MAIDQSAMRTIYHKQNGPATMFKIDAAHALTFKDEWSTTPWGRDGNKEPATVDIPPDWQDGKPLERINLAVQLGAERKGLTAAKADDFIQAEVEKREAAAAAPVEPEKKPDDK